MIAYLAGSMLEGLFARLPIACKNTTAASEAEQIISPSNRARRNGLFLSAAWKAGRHHLNLCSSSADVLPPPVKRAATLNECIYLITDNKTGLDEVAASSDTAFQGCAVDCDLETCIKL